MKKLRVFISSVMNELEPERDVAIDTITNLGMKPTYFETHAGVKSPLTDSLRLVQQSDITLVILWKQYSRVVEEEYKYAELLNKPVIVLEKELKGGEQRESQLNAFLNRIKDRHVYKKFRTPSQLREKIIIAIQQVIYDAFRSIIKLPNEDIYSQIRNVLKNAKNVCILSRTPILLFGHRLYLSKNKLPEEKEGYLITSQLLEDAVEGDREFTLIVSSYSVIEEIRNYPNSKALAKFVLNNFEDLCKKQTETFKVACTSFSPLPHKYLTFIVADNTVIIWIKSSSTNHCIISENTDLAFAFRYLANEYVMMDDKIDYKTKLMKVIRKL